MEDAGTEEPGTLQAATHAASLMALLARTDTAKQTKIWLGAGLGSVSRKLYERMLRWEFIDLGELCPKNPLDKPVEDAQKWIVPPGFEIPQVRRKSIDNIITWTHCYGRYTGAMAKNHPNSMPGFMAHMLTVHMLTVLKAYTEVEDPAWRQYDDAFREKMAATGCKLWEGMDTQLYRRQAM